VLAARSKLPQGLLGAVVKDVTSENAVLLQALQASHGLISADMRAIAVQMIPDGVVLHFAVNRETDELKEDVDDILFEMDAFLETRVLLKAGIHLGYPDGNRPGRRHRLLYLAKDIDAR
jgi:hypothetical protein